MPNSVSGDELAQRHPVQSEIVGARRNLVMWCNDSQPMYRVSVNAMLHRFPLAPSVNRLCLPQWVKGEHPPEDAHAGNLHVRLGEGALGKRRVYARESKQANG